MKMRLIVCLLLLGVFCMVIPVRVQAVTGIPFGGLVTAMFPCANGVFYVVVVGVHGGSFIYMPFGTITFLFGPPRPGAFILGNADVPSFCYFPPHTFIPGLRMQMIGTGGL